MSANDVGFSVCTTSKQWDCLNAQTRMNHCQRKYKSLVKACQGSVSIVTYITSFLNAFSWFCCHGLSEMTMKNGIVSFCCINIYYAISLYRSGFFHSMYPYLGSSIYLQTSVFFLFYSWIVFRHICVPNFHYSFISLGCFYFLPIFRMTTTMYSHQQGFSFSITLSAFLSVDLLILAIWLGSEEISKLFSFAFP